jgi:NAD(P)-dependent dehydrogenase (short-subunit alcohol dehydrogenase family)
MKTLFDLEGRTALIAGSGGLGKGMAKGLALAGADVVLADLNPANAAEGARLVREHGRKSLELTFDINDRSSIEKMVDDALGFRGRIDILANSVGISLMGHAEDFSLEDWNAVMQAFLTGVFSCCQVVARKAMIPQKYGKIINVASMSGMVVTGDMGSAYEAAKAGVIQLSRALGTEWAKYGINVNCISPGYMLTPLTEGFLSNPQMSEPILNATPKRRFGRPDDMAGAVVFLASDCADYVLAHNLVLDGGYTAM